MKPSRTGSIVIAEAILLPALTAELVMLANAVTPITSNAENLARIVSMPEATPENSSFLVAAPTSSSPFDMPLKLSLAFNLSNVDILV